MTRRHDCHLFADELTFDTTFLFPILLLRIGNWNRTITSLRLAENSVLYNAGTCLNYMAIKLTINI